MSLTDEAIAKIKEMILGGRLRPGDRLPREADLSEELAISRSSLREAVRALALVNVLDVRQGDGTYVTSLQSDLLLETLNFITDFHQDSSVLHLFEVRRILEPAAAEQAAVSMEDAAVRALTAMAEELADVTDIDDLVANDIDFHHRIAEASGNPVLCSFLDSLSGRTQRARIWRGLTQSDALERTLREHRAIASAIAASDPALARAWATIHVAGVEDWLREALQDRRDLP
jgi:GntR family transcriptional regulator, transcriptional repressor for pyruvate dehydrogenase complex